jgi:SAM-dependent MidA family methyltransferase
VVECGAGDGALAAAVLNASPGLDYFAVEVSAPLRAEAAARLGDRATVLGELPREPITGVVLANELLDNLPFDVYVGAARKWSEARVMGGQEILVPAAAEAAAELSQLAPSGGRVPRQLAARAWLAGALQLVKTGSVIVFDYARSTQEMAAGVWLRTYRRGGPGGHPLSDPGTQDITADVAIDQLSLVRTPSSVMTQAEWLDAHGLPALERAAADAWWAAAARPDLAALRARSRVGEAAALRDPAALGAFTVMEWRQPG